MQDEEEDVNSYWMTLGKREVTESWKRKHLITLSEEHALEGIMDLSQGRLRDDDEDGP